ncbi:MAG: hypothetical protein H6905_07540 [Hyphomicrobiales bacterium]|nr:hypothetical protein [Hyphomicrobiales bacterium]
MIGVVLWQWEKVQAVPGISWLLRRVRRRRLPKYDPKRYGVAVLRLQDDKSDIWRTRIVEDLEEFSGIESRALDRCIGLDIHAREDSETEGHALARTFLKGTGASVAIWGRVIGEGEASRAKLYFTTVSKGVERYNRYGVAENQRLPELFWADLINILNLIISTGYVQFHEAQGKYIADELVPFIGRVKQVVQDQQKLLKWTGEQRHRVNVMLGDALSTLGEQKRQRGPLLEAARAFREALVVYDRKFVHFIGHWSKITWAPCSQILVKQTVIRGA